MMQRLDVGEFIARLSTTDPYIKTIFMQGGCYQFHLLLASMFDNTKPLINAEKNHVVSEIGGQYWDINGLVKEKNLQPLSEADYELVRSWSFSKNSFLSIGECPVCEEPLLISSAY